MRMPGIKRVLCGGTTRLAHAGPATPAPGNATSATTGPTRNTTRSPEWVCPDCDYFEEADEEGS